MKPQSQMPVGAEVNISKIPMDAWVKHELSNKDSEWLTELLKELNENATTKSPEAWLDETHVNLKLSWIKHFKGEMGEYLLVKCAIESHYATECVTTLQPMNMDLKVEFQAAFVPQKIVDSEEYQETSEIWLDGETWELYGYSKNMIQLFEMVHEQVYLNYDYYPRLDAKQDEPSELS
jgi:uncharacterized metal-binding protein YceD (DUF177 family)